MPMYDFKVGDRVVYDHDNNVLNSFKRGDTATVVFIGAPAQAEGRRIILVRWDNPRGRRSQASLYEYKFKPSGGPW